MVKKNKNIAILISNKGTGSNLAAIIKAIEDKKINYAKIAVVLANKADSLGLNIAKDKGIPIEIADLAEYRKKGKTRLEYDNYLGELLKKKYEIDLVVLAGWMLILSKEFIRYFPNKIINLHPALLPDIGEDCFACQDGTKIYPVRGKHTDSAVSEAIKNRYPVFGSTVHFITPVVDEGPVILRSSVKVKANDTVETLYERMKKEEHKVLPEAVSYFTEDRLEINKSGKVKIKNVK
jgi:phosphoribosylglycinamide formyltransferase 1